MSDTHVLVFRTPEEIVFRRHLEPSDPVVIPQIGHKIRLTHSWEPDDDFVVTDIMYVYGNYRVEIIIAVLPLEA